MKTFMIGKDEGDDEPLNGKQNPIEKLDIFKCSTGIVDDEPLCCPEPVPCPEPPPPPPAPEPEPEPEPVPEPTPDPNPPA
jgi:hypothetical protein